MRHLLPCLLLMPALACADIYRWTDAQGRVHFSERPQEGAERIEVQPRIQERDSATREREARAAKFHDARRDEQAAASARAAQLREQRQKKCGQLREQRQTLENGRTFYRFDERGDRQYYTDEEIRTFRRELDERMARECG